MRPKPRKHATLGPFPAITPMEEHAPIEMRGPPSRRLRSSGVKPADVSLVRSATCAEAPSSLLQAVVNVVDASPTGEEWESLMMVVDQFAPEMAKDSSDHVSVGYLGGQFIAAMAIWRVAAQWQRHCVRCPARGLAMAQPWLGHYLGG